MTRNYKKKKTLNIYFKHILVSTFLLFLLLLYYSFIISIYLFKYWLVTIGTKFKVQIEAKN